MYLSDRRAVQGSPRLGRIFSQEWAHKSFFRTSQGSVYYLAACTVNALMLAAFNAREDVRVVEALDRVHRLWF